MTEVIMNRVCQLWILTGLLFCCVSLTASVSLDLTELRNKVAKIKVNPRGNLWATGHFMGKKSVLDSPMMEDESLGAALQPDLSEQELRELITEEVLKVALQAQLQDTRGKEDFSDKDTGILLKVLGSYIQNTRK
ncbi:neuromedin Ba [Polypterus senegalus]|uniref:neuromedin Ba n=1 Tax=Polypterus senegalus TaxID=55291 RepID=UPI001965AAF4|nr:neuromedin Ba [Polypterus senegalus]